MDTNTGGQLDREGNQEAPRIAVIIPALNEAAAITKVIAAIPAHLTSEIVVVNNNSTDATAERAREAGATVLDEPRQGYGSACLRGIEYLLAKPAKKKPEIVVFLDGDYSDYPEEMSLLVNPVMAGECDLAIGKRVHKATGAMTGHQTWGNWLATTLIKLLYGFKFTDLGPFRAISFNHLMQLNMSDRTYGWTVEMQVKAVKNGLSICEIPVSYKPRIGKSKISGNLLGSIKAGYKIIITIIKLR